MNDPTCLALALGTYGYRLFVKPLLPLKMKMTGITLILINRHWLPHQSFPVYFTVTAILKAKISLIVPGKPAGCCHGLGDDEQGTGDANKVSLSGQSPSLG
jgi:hypothetical protein